MADRTSAKVFGRCFEKLASYPMIMSDFADFLMKLRGDYDFTPDQMCCDNALLKLRLARYNAANARDDVEYDTRYSPRHVAHILYKYWDDEF